VRSRNIKPGFFKNEELAEIPFEARLLFIGLWAMADREGRLEDRPKKLKAEIFPFDNINMEKLLDVITLRGFTLRYEIDGKRYVQIINFKKHQNPHPHEAKSEIPPMSLQAVKCHLPAVLIPDVLIPDVRNPDTTGPLHGAARIKEIEGWFEKIWEEYPQKGRVGKKAALRHFCSSVKTIEDAKRCARSLERYLESKRVKEGYVQNGSTWFNDWQSWENYTEVKDGTVNS
jgi:hypothetical protein